VVRQHQQFASLRVDFYLVPEPGANRPGSREAQIIQRQLQRFIQARPVPGFQQSRPNDEGQ
jgi:hypothetical protein